MTKPNDYEGACRSKVAVFASVVIYAPHMADKLSKIFLEPKSHGRNYPEANKAIKILSEKILTATKNISQDNYRKIENTLWQVYNRLDDSKNETWGVAASALRRALTHYKIGNKIC